MKPTPPPMPSMRPTDPESLDSPRTQIIIAIAVGVLILLMILCWMLFSKSDDSGSEQRAAQKENSESLQDLNVSGLAQTATVSQELNQNPESDDANRSEAKVQNNKATTTSETAANPLKNPPGKSNPSTSGSPKVSGAKVDSVKQTGQLNANQIGISGILENPVKFFGVEADAGNIVFVIDKSSSMRDQNRLQRAKTELISSIQSLNDSQSFGIIWFDSTAVPQVQHPIAASDQNKQIQIRRIRIVNASGGTNPTPAIEKALNTKADALFLLSDGEVDQRCVSEIAKLNTNKIPIHTISFSPSVVYLKKIADESGGFFNFAK